MRGAGGSGSRRNRSANRAKDRGQRAPGSRVDRSRSPFSWVLTVTIARACTETPQTLASHCRAARVGRRARTLALGRAGEPQLAFESPEVLRRSFSRRPPRRVTWTAELV